MKIAVVYGRTSSQRQKAQGISIPAQIDACRQWCAAHGYEAQVYVDEGKSGTSLYGRPQFRAAEAAACAAKAPLVTYSLSRCCRSLRDTLDLAARLDAAGAQLVSLSENWDTATATGRMVLSVLGAVNQYEAEIASERTSRVFAHCRATGRPTGRAPFGYRISESLDGGKRERRLQQDPATFPVLKTILDMSGQGSKPCEIADQLNEDRVPPPGGPGKRGAGPKRWHAASVAAVIAANRRRAEAGAAGQGPDA
jgi:DNA invertase Pin-like site-specific DNA recombinase